MEEQQSSGKKGMPERSRCWGPGGRPVTQRRGANAPNAAMEIRILGHGFPLLFLEISIFFLSYYIFKVNL
jgi:hypothetical protein